MGSITKAVYNTGLALWWGGTAMGALAMNPAVEVLDDPEERGKMVDEGWARFQPYAAAGLTSAFISHLILRRGTKGTGGARLLKDLLMVTAVVSSIASLALGEYAVQDYDSYTPSESPEELGGEVETESKAPKSLTTASIVQLASGLGLFFIGALMAGQHTKAKVR